MKRKNTTRNALFTSIVSMLLCVSMLVGTTFAWFTDEVVTGMNTIAAGNLDVELLADGAEVDSNTKLFNLVNAAGNDTWWEPGMVVYENLQVANVGTLALRYQLSLNFGKENDLSGHKLSEVLKIAVIDKVAANATRAEVLEAAKASKEVGTLASFRIAGELLPGEKSDEQTFVIFWEPNDNATDNLYNANNGQQTSDGEPLHIEFGVNLQATQKMHEEDSFGNDYDFVGFKPVANVNGSADLKVQATTNDMGNNATATTYVLNTAYQFKPTETYEEAQNSPYRYWHADFVVKADKDVPANSMALAGYYQAFCDGYNNGNWVALTANETITAGTEIRLVDVMGNGSITVNYEELCKYADITDPNNVGFMCGAADLTGENAGTTITVELRMYETTGDPLTTTGSKNKETGNYEVIGSYSYTFGSKAVATADELASLLTSNDDSIQVTLMNDIDLPMSSLGSQTPGSGEYKLGGENTEEIIIDLNGHKLTLTTGYMTAIGAKNADATITIKNGSMNGTGNSAATWNINDLIFANCNYVIENVVFDKEIALENTGKSATLKNVTINGTGDYYAMWISARGQNVEIDGLTVKTPGRGIKIDEQYVATPGKVSLKVSNATFETANKAAIMVKSSAGAEIHLSNVDISNVVADSANEVWVDEDSAAYASKVKVVGGSKFVEGTMVFEAATAQELEDLLTSNTASGSGDNVINLTADLDMSTVNWTPITVQGYTGAGVITLNGNGKTIKGLNAPLFAGGFAGNSGIVIKNLTIADSNIVSTSTTGSGAFIESVDSMQSITLDNCHLKNSTVSGSRTGGLIGWTSGYSNPSDGPVKTYVTITNCSVVGCTITGTSVGAINGHAGASDWTYTTIENCTVTGCTLNSTDTGDWRVGVVVGTANIGEVTINNITESGNTLTQTGKTAPAGQSNLYGRFVPGSTGKLVIDGVAVQ